MNANTHAQSSSARDAAIDAALSAAHAQFEQDNPLSRAQFNTNTGVMPGANSRSTLFSAPFPATIARGAGAKLWDLDGHEYTDFIAEYTAGVYGHSAPEIREAVMAAMDDGINLCGHNLYEGRLASIICERLPSIERIRFTNSGTEANLMAISTALVNTGRSRIVVFDGAYHGGVLTISRHLAPPTVPYDFLVLPYNDAATAQEQIRQHGPSIAAVLVEPMMGAGGCIPGDAAFLHTLRLATQEVGALLIFDEVMTSRLAGHGLQGVLDIRPDLTTLGKYIGGGMTFGAFGGRADLMSIFDPRNGKVGHSGTFNNNVVTMAAGIAGLTKLYPPEVADQLSAKGAALREALNRATKEAGVALQFSGVGSTMNAHFVSGPIRRPEDVAGVDNRLRGLLHHFLLQRGFYIASRGMIVLSLPLTDPDIAGFKNAIGEFLAHYRELLPRR